MGFFVNDQSQICMFHESGLYATVSGTAVWPGLVQSHDIDTGINKEKLRYCGTSTRNVGRFVDTVEDHTGTLSMYPQDWRFLFFALGSVVDGGSPSPYTHVISEQNSGVLNGYTSGTLIPWVSFSLEDSQKVGITGANFIRTMNGCVADELTISASEGDRFVSVEVPYIAKSCIYTSGAPSTVTEVTTAPYLWQDCKVYIPSGTLVQGLTGFSWHMANGMVPKHYGTGSATVEAVVPSTRDYDFTLDIDPDSTQRKAFYNQYFRGGSEFNCMLHIGKGTGSNDLYLVMSGCQIDDMDDPTSNDGAVCTESITVIPKTASAAVDDQVLKYAAW